MSRSRRSARSPRSRGRPAAIGAADAVELARRLEECADPGTVHASPAAHALLEDDFQMTGRGITDLGDQQLRTYVLAARIRQPAV